MFPASCWNPRHLFNIRSGLPSSNIFLSHDWPVHCNENLFWEKIFRRAHKVRRPYWVSFTACTQNGGSLLVYTPGGSWTRKRRSGLVIFHPKPWTDKFEPLKLGEELHVHASPSVLPKPRPAKTKFLALNKCFPRRQPLAVKKETFHHLASLICFIRVVSIDDTLPYFGRRPPLLSNGEQSPPMVLDTSTTFPRRCGGQEACKKSEWIPAGVTTNQVRYLFWIFYDWSWTWTW